MSGRRKSAACPGLPKQRGVALLIALLVVTLASVAAAAILARERYAIRLAGNIIHGDQACLCTTSMEAWAADLLRRDAHAGRADDLGEAWARPLGPVSIGDGTASGRIQDLQGRFNVNDLVVGGRPSALDVRRFRRLLKVLGIAPRLSAALVDWLDADSRMRLPGGAEDGTYLGLPVPYRAANAPLRSVSELRLIVGFGPETVQRLQRYVSALPARTGINVNTAPVPVLESLAEGIDRGTAVALAAARRHAPFANLRSFLSSPLLKGKRPDPDGLAVASSYFRLSAAAQVGTAYVQTASVLRRGRDGRTEVIARSRSVPRTTARLAGADTAVSAK